MPQITADFDWLSDLSALHEAQETWRNGQYDEETIFHLVYQPEGLFSIACGASLLAEHIRRFRFSPDIIQRLGQVTDRFGRCHFDESFLNYLQRMRLRVNVTIPQEGMLLLPEEPLLIARGPMAQVQVLASAFKYLIWNSTHWATLAATKRWNQHRWKEVDTPHAPSYGFSPEGWKVRASFIGGASMAEIKENKDLQLREPNALEGLKMIWSASKGNMEGVAPLTQIRRLYKGTQSLGDVWLTAEQDRLTSVSKTSIQLSPAGSDDVRTIKCTRFQNIYQPIIAKGQAVLVPTRKGYLRQRTLHQLAAFHAVNLGAYARGWYV